MWKECGQRVWQISFPRRSAGGGGGGVPRGNEEPKIWWEETRRQYFVLGARCEKWCFCARRNFAFFGKTNVQKEGGF